MSDFLLGGQVRESVSQGSSTIVGSAKYNIGFIGERERGIPNKPILVNTLQDDRLKFGGVSPTKFGAFIVRDFILNAQPYYANIYMVRILDSSSAVASGLFGVQLTSAFTVAAPIFTVWAGQNGSKDPGTWANSVRTNPSTGVFFRCYPKGHINGLLNQYLVKIFYNGEAKETFSATTWAELISKVNINSSYVLLEPTNLTLDITDVVEVYPTGGTYVPSTESMYTPVHSDTNPQGLAIFDGILINEIACTEFQTVSMATTGIAYAAAHKDLPIYAYSLPYGTSDSALATASATLLTSGIGFGAGYNAWLQVSDEKGGKIWVPSVGAVLGLFVRVPSDNSDNLVFPPAGSDSLLVGVYDVTPIDLDINVYTRWAKRYGTNVIRRKVSPTGTNLGDFYVGSSRTNSTNPLFQSVHIRRLMSYWGASLLTFVESKAQKPLTPSSSKDLFTGIYKFFLAEYRAEALENSIPFAQACIINITTDTSDRKVRRIVVSVIPTECQESIVLTIERNDSSLNLSIN